MSRCRWIRMAAMLVACNGGYGQYTSNGYPGGLDLALIPVE